MTLKREMRIQSFKATKEAPCLRNSLNFEIKHSNKSIKEPEQSPINSFRVPEIESNQKAKQRERTNVSYKQREAGNYSDEENLLEIKLSEINLSESKEEAQFQFIKNLIAQDWIRLNLNSPIPQEN